jgi:multiple sugar transport system ATP-binding protein
VNDLQKVALGRSMIMQPTIFLLDEPFSNLDSAFRAYMRAELKRIQHEVGQTMVYVTHDQVEAMGMADRIAVMELGVLQQYGSPEDLYERPANTFVARFIGSVLNNFIPARYADGALHIGDGSVALGDRRSVFESHVPAAGLTATIRPERVRVVDPGSDEVTIRGEVMLVEPLGPKDVVHLEHQGTEMRVVVPPNERPAVGSALGLYFDPAQVHVFDDETGLAVR